VNNNFFAQFCYKLKSLLYFNHVIPMFALNKGDYNVCSRVVVVLISPPCTFEES